jgi:predicted peptidase
MTNEHGGSIYTESVVELINSFKEEKGCTKVVIAGDSNGGFMTMNLAINHPEVADAYIPVCEAYKDSYISDDEIAELAKLNIFFVFSLDDPTVDPTQYEQPTIARLQKAGAENLHVATTEHVIGYVDDEDPEHEYSGHWSWIYFENGDSVCNDDGINAWDWIADIVK